MTELALAETFGSSHTTRTTGAPASVTITKEN